MLFAVNLPLGVLALWIGRRALPDSPLGGEKFDAASAALNAAFFGLLILGIDGFGHGQDRNSIALELGGAVAIGMQATSRRLGQTIGSALVAMLFNLVPIGGTQLVLLVAAGFSVAAGVLSLFRPPTKL